MAVDPQEWLKAQQQPKRVDPQEWLRNQQAAKISQPSGVNVKPATGFERLSWGMFEPMIGAGQLLAKGLSFGEEPGTFLGDLSQTVDDYWKQQAQQKKQSAELAGFGENGKTDALGAVGNIVSPVNVALMGAKVAKPAMGALLGATAGAANPVYEGDFATQKALQVGAGGLAGGLSTAFINKVAGMANSALLRKSLPENPEIVGARASLQADEAITKALNDIGLSNSDVPPALLQKVRDETLNYFKSGKEVDPAALFRKSDFDALGVQPLTGQITRDPAQFSRELNLRGAIPEISQVLNNQQQALKTRIGGLAQGADDAYTAGQKLITPLDDIVSQQKATQDALYSAARDESGRSAMVNTKQFSDMANDALDSQMLGHYLPGETRKLLNDISSGKIPFNVNNMVQADTVLSKAQRAAKNKGDDAGALAIGQIRNALNKAEIMDESGINAKAAFDTARNTARQHFELRNQNPALQAVADDDAIPDNFVNKFIIRGSVDEVKRLASLLPDDARQQARAQLGAELQRAAFGEFGENVAPERFAKAIRTIGKDKLAAFFSPEEIDDLLRVSRVAAYISKAPAGDTVNRSNTFVAAAGESPFLKNLMFGDSTAGRLLAGALKAGSGAIKNQMAASNAMKANVPVKNAPLSPEQLAALTRSLGISSALSGGMAGDNFGQ